jgi:hypothetical protein
MCCWASLRLVFALVILACQGGRAQYAAVNFNYSIDCTSLTSWSSTAVVIRNPDQFSSQKWLPTGLIDMFGTKIYVTMAEERKCSDMFREFPKGIYGGAAAPSSSLAALGAPAPAPAPAPGIIMGDVYQYTPYDAQTVVSTKRLRDCCISEYGQDGKALTMPAEVNRPAKEGCIGCFRGENRFCSFRIWQVDTLMIQARGLCRYCEQINCRTKCPDGKVRNAGVV